PRSFAFSNMRMGRLMTAIWRDSMSRARKRSPMAAATGAAGLSRPRREGSIRNAFRHLLFGAMLAGIGLTCGQAEASPQGLVGARAAVAENIVQAPTAAPRPVARQAVATNARLED